MNTNDVRPFKYDENSFDLMFKKHYELFKEYMKTDRFEWSEAGFDINVSDDQFMLKDMLQIRFIEELTEASVTLEEQEHTHYLEEIVDAFNFLLAGYFIYGWTYKDLDEWVEAFGWDYNDPEDLKMADVDRYKNRLDMCRTDKVSRLHLKACFYDVVEQTGRACNYLKNYRTWKSCQYLVDLKNFEREFKKIWNTFNELCNISCISRKLLFEIWSQKYQINKFRMESSY